MNCIEIIQKHSLTVRCLPHKVVSHWAYREGQKIKDNQTIVELPKWSKLPHLKDRKFIKEVREVKCGGWWYVKETKHTYSSVEFSRKSDKFFAPTLEEALGLYLDSIK